jgi:hypothetical protein
VRSPLVSILLCVPLSVLAAEKGAGAPELRPDVRAQADEEKVLGDEALVGARPAEALEHYDASLKLFANPALHYNRGRALQGLERYPEAVEAFERFVKTAPPELRARVPKLDALLLEVRSKASALEVTCNIAGAEVRIGDTVIGQTPLARRPWNAGRVKVEVRAAGYHPFIRQVNLPPAGVAVVEAPLSLENTTALLKLNASVPGASLSINDVARGTAPFEGYLPVGPHRILLTAEGFEPSVNEVVMSLGPPRELSVELVKTPRFYERWYFWGAIISAIAAGTAVGIAWSIERPAKEGTLGLTSVSGPTP